MHKIVHGFILAAIAVAWLSLWVMLVVPFISYAAQWWAR